ncbi:MAG: hypothetical protein OSJ62_07670 [Lachnospiraceae bacterium]|nr:hypothetical protein [Lachnospiraceae bacterium]
MRKIDTMISREEHKEFVRRMDEANERQSKRISVLEEEVRQISDLTISINRMSISIENMTVQLVEQGKRLQALESRDGEMWRKVTGYLVTAVVGIVIGFLFQKIGL